MAAKQPTAQLIFPNREAVTTGQLQNAMMVCSTAITGLIHWHRDDEESKYTPQDSEARIALENTLITACARLDKILIDDRRWSIEYQMGLENEFKKSHASNLAFLESQQKASEEVASPHFQHRPRLAKSEDGQLWVAIMGDEKDLDNAVLGIGRTPEEALAEFDKNFQGKEKSPEVIAFLKGRAEQFQKNYGQEKLDEVGTGKPQYSLSGGDNGEDDGGEIRQTRGVGPGADATLGPKSVAYGKSAAYEEEVRVRHPQPPRGSQVSPKTGLRTVAAFLSRLFRLDKNRSGQ